MLYKDNVLNLTPLQKIWTLNHLVADLYDFPVSIQEPLYNEVRSYAESTVENAKARNDIHILASVMAEKALLDYAASQQERDKNIQEMIEEIFAKSITENPEDTIRAIYNSLLLTSQL